MACVLVNAMVLFTLTKEGTIEMAQAPVEIIIRGQHDTGRTTIGILFRQFLQDTGFADVEMVDTPPIDDKSSWPDRFERNKMRPIRIKVETVK